ncbi:hypothetical protein RhiirA5_442091, partial [Rhizophagus irregularis]
AKFETTKEDEFKVLIRSLIIGNRKRIDEEYYLEMLMIEKFLQEEKMKLDIFEHPELKNEFIEEKMEKLLLTLKKENKSFSGVIIKVYKIFLFRLSFEIKIMKELIIVIVWNG